MTIESNNFSCPVPIMDHKTIQLAHGAGGRLSQDLISKMFLPRFSNATLNKLEDQAVLTRPTGRIAFSTDTYVVDPIFFPGGNIGELAINGTVNDISMSGAVPHWLSVGFIIEEGFPMEDLHRIVLAMEKNAKLAQVQIVTGDTKVVNKGSCDKLFINTSGIGVIEDGVNISSANISVGDKIIVSGTIADHGIAILTARKGLSFESRIESDTAPLNHLIQKMLKVSKKIHALRDPTRGGVATTLNEFASQCNLGIQLYDTEIPTRAEVIGACEILGIDPLYVANEGKLIAVVDSNDAGKVLDAMRNHELGKDAQIIGEVIAENRSMVVLRTPFGVNRIVDMPIGELLPRIC